MGTVDRALLLLWLSIGWLGSKSDQHSLCLSTILDQVTVVVMRCRSSSSGSTCLLGLESKGMVSWVWALVRSPPAMLCFAPSWVPKNEQAGNIPFENSLHESSHHYPQLHFQELLLLSNCQKVNLAYHYITMPVSLTSPPRMPWAFCHLPSSLQEG